MMTNVGPNANPDYSTITNFTKQDLTQPSIKQKIDGMLKQGYRMEELMVTQDGDVIFNPDACYNDSFKRHLPDEPEGKS